MIAERAPYRRWVKACACQSTATTNEIRMTEEDRGAKGIFMVAKFIPGPSCDRCGKAWDEAQSGREDP